nr:phosphatidate cytidylyltransferase [Bacteroidales bacterium]
MNKFLIRTLSGAVYVAIVVCSIFLGKWTDNALLGNAVFACVFFVIGIIGIYEYVHNLELKGVKSNKPMAFIAGIATYVALTIPPMMNNGTCGDPFTLYYFAIIMAGLVPVMYLTTFLVQLWHNDSEPFTTVGHTLLPSIWIMTPLALLNDVQSVGAGLTMMIFILIWVNDSFAYMTGMLLGKHKMWERHSPNKTWEGTIGGVVFCIAAAIFVGPLFYPHIHIMGWAIIGLICSVVGTLGDLVESMFKRYCGVKDSGNIMPGHGGVLDRFDSILMAVPFVLLFLGIIN